MIPGLQSLPIPNPLIALAYIIGYMLIIGLLAHATSLVIRRVMDVTSTYHRPRAILAKMAILCLLGGSLMYVLVMLIAQISTVFTVPI